MGKLFSAGTRLITGESLFLTHFTHRGRLRQKPGGLFGTLPRHHYSR